NDLVAEIEEKISAWTFLPKENGRFLQVLHFGLEKANQNYDYLGNKSSLELGEPLMATVVLYLSNVSQGGEILFPHSEISQSRNKFLSDCTKTSHALKPVKGNALLFFNSRPNASPDKTSSHARCPVQEGELWCATKFFYLRPISRENVLSEADDEGCSDEDEKCPNWAAVGECKRNPVFMIGTSDYYGTCRKSCKAC
ncbi:Prolyl 4-hydroxylase alpha subunit, Fe(2+) 2OG dioxygenase domain, partial [Dillenia turbinata]